MASNKKAEIEIRSSATAVHYFPSQQAFLTTNEDQTLKIWLRRFNGDFWPSVSNPLQAIARTIACYCANNSYTVLVGLSNGGIEEFAISQDFNSIQSRGYYCAHSMPVTQIVLQNSYIFSVADDGFISCRFSGDRIISNRNISSCGKCLLVDPSLMLIVGTNSGVIDVFRVNVENFNTLKPIKSLESHEGKITALEWSNEHDYLVSADITGDIILWDFGGKTGMVVKMNLHSSPVVLLKLSPGSNFLMSISSRGIAGFWNMNYKRHMRGEMEKANICCRCNSHFIWNLKAIFSSKSLGSRRHHCRNCFKSFCGKCCHDKMIIPKLGYEVPVLVCIECQVLLLQENNKPEMVSLILDVNRISCACYAEETKTLVTSSVDRRVTMWDFGKSW